MDQQLASRRRAIGTVAFGALASPLLGGRPRTVPSTPLPTGHAHNDYEHPSPFHGTFGLGFRSIEVDVFPVDGALLVAHDAKDLHPDRTLQSMYLEPILQRCRAADDETRGPCPHGHRLTLLVDIKRNGPRSTELLLDELAPLEPWLRRVERGQVVDGPIEVIVSGSRPIDMLAAMDTRSLFVDGRPGDLESPPSASLMPLISASFKSELGTYGIRGIDAGARSRIAELATLSRKHGRRLRFFGHMEAPWVWSTLVKNRVDLIGSDVPWALARWLRANDPRCRRSGE